MNNQKCECLMCYSIATTSIWPTKEGRTCTICNHIVSKKTYRHKVEIYCQTATPKLSDCTCHTNEACLHCDVCSKTTQNNDNLGKTTPPVERVSENKPSTVEDWEKEFEDHMSHLYWQSCICCQRAMKYKENIRSLLQKERESIAGICEKAYFGAFQRGYHKGVETVKQQILKDNQ